MERVPGVTSGCPTPTAHASDLEPHLAVPVILLQAAYRRCARSELRDPRGRCERGRHCREARHAVHDRGAADVVTVGARSTPAWSVDHEVDLAGGDELDRVHPGFLIHLG